MRKIIFTMALALAAMAVQAKDKTVVLTTTPTITCNNCVNKIKSNIRFVKGVKKIDPSLKTKKVSIVYDDAKAGQEDIVKGFAKIGYRVNVVTDSVK